MRAKWQCTDFGKLSGIWRLTLDGCLDLPRDNDAWMLHHTGPHSYLYRVGGHRPMLAKFIVPRSRPRDSLRKYVHCQAKREYDSAALLKAAGLRRPDVYGWGVSPCPGARFESLLFMEWIRPFHSALTLIREEGDSERRRRFFPTLALETARLHGHGLIHKDGHFGNLGLQNDGALIWIDNDIRRARSARALKTGFTKMLALLRHTARGDVSDNEWQLFRDRLTYELGCWPKARMLANEI